MTDFVDPLVIAQITASKDLLVQEVARATPAVDIIEAYAGSLGAPSIPEAPIDGEQYARQDGDWEVVTGAGGTANWGGIGGTLADQEDLVEALDLKTDDSTLATVAKTGSYNDLTGKPTILAEAPVDTKQYTRQDASWVELALPSTIDGLTTTGDVTHDGNGGKYIELEPDDSGTDHAQIHSRLDLFGELAWQTKTDGDGSWFKDDSYNAVFRRFAFLDEIPTGSSTAWGDITGTLTSQTDLVSALALKTDDSSLSDVATSGSYADLTNTPAVSAPTVNGDALGSADLIFDSTDFDVDFDPFAPSYTVTAKSSGGVEEAPNDGLQYARQSEAWTEVVSGGGTSGGGGIDYTTAQLVETYSPYASSALFLPSAKVIPNGRLLADLAPIGTNSTNLNLKLSEPSVYGFVDGDEFELMVTNIPCLSSTQCFNFAGSGGNTLAFLMGRSGMTHSTTSNPITAQSNLVINMVAITTATLGRQWWVKQVDVRQELIYYSK